MSLSIFLKEVEGRKIEKLAAKSGLVVRVFDLSV